MSLTPIDLFKGWPATHLLPINRFKEAATKKLSDKSILEEAFGYGPDEGHFPLRQNIAKWLSDFYAPAQPIEAERICITGGASQNLASILQVFTDPLRTERIWLPVPTYHLVFQTFEDAGFHGRMGGVPEDELGMDVDALEEALEKFESSQTNESSSGHYVCPHVTYWGIPLIIEDCQATHGVQEDLHACHLLCSQLFKSLGDCHANQKTRVSCQNCS